MLEFVAHFADSVADEAECGAVVRGITGGATENVVIKFSRRQWTNRLIPMVLELLSEHYDSEATEVWAYTSTPGKRYRKACLFEKLV